MSEGLIYETESGQTQVSVRLESEMVWLNLNQMTELFRRDKSVKDNVPALALLVAESDPANKDFMIRLVVNLLVSEAA